MQNNKNRQMEFHLPIFYLIVAENAKKLIGRF